VSNESKEESEESKDDEGREDPKTIMARQF